ncbi:MAG: YlxR family protein [Eggerthellaceae bacterium]
MNTVAPTSAKLQRRCVACSRSTDKASLLRIVRGQGSVFFDATGKSAGRGAYVCSLECFEVARKTRRLERALKAPLAHDDYERIAADIAVATRQM